MRSARNSEPARHPSPSRSTRSPGCAARRGRVGRGRGCPSRRDGARWRPRPRPGRRSSAGRAGTRWPETTADTSSAVPSANVTVWPATPTTRGWIVTDGRRRVSRRGEEPISAGSRRFIRRPMRVRVLFSISRRRVEPPEEVLPQEPLRKRRLARADREVDRPCVRQLVSDLEPRVATADNEDRLLREARRRPVADAVELDHVGREPLGDRRDERHLEGTGRDDDLISPVRRVADGERVAAALAGGQAVSTRPSTATGSSK